MKKMIQLYKHNQEAYDAVNKQFKSKNRACVVCATGTGKSRIALKLIEDHITENVLYIASSKDAIEGLQEDLLTEVTGYKTNRHVTFSVFQGLWNHYLWLKDQPENYYKYIIIDEVHHYGAPKYGKWTNHILDLNENAKVLGMTATPIRSSDGRNIVMELFSGNISYELPLPKAIIRGILPMPHIILCRLDPADIIQLWQDNRSRKEITYWKQNTRFNIQTQDTTNKKKNIANKLGPLFKSYMPNPNGHYIIFCRNIDHLNNIAEQCAAWFAEVSEHIHLFIDHSKQHDKRKGLDAFNQCEKHGIKILLCVDKLNESVHPTTGIDGLILLRPTKSQQIYLQQMGRALSANFSQSNPVIFDIVGNSKAIHMRKSFWTDQNPEFVSFGQPILFIADFTEKNEMDVFSHLVDRTNHIQVPWDLAYKKVFDYYETNKCHTLRVPMLASGDNRHFGADLYRQSKSKEKDQCICLFLS